MITGLILDALFGALDALFSLLPALAIPTPSETEFPAIMGNLNQVFPVQQLLLALAFCLLVKLTISLWDFAVFVYHQFWGAS